MGWVNLAMGKILLVTLGWDRMTAVLISLDVTGAYSAVSGLWGVVVTDLFQFVLAMAGTIALAWFALGRPEVGGIDGLRAQLPDSAFRFLPEVGDITGAPALSLALPVATFIAFVGVQWWVSWYPGAEPGGGYVAQRTMSAHDERHSLLATLWFTVAHYCVRPWRGSSSGSHRSCCTRTSQIAKPAMSWCCATTCPPAGGACCWPHSSRPICPPSARN